MGWGFFFMMVVLKIPVALLLWLVWWAIHAEVEPPGEDEGPDDDGDTGPHRPRAPKPRPSRRGPHRDPAPCPPARVRGPVRAPAPGRPGRLPIR